MILYSVPPGKLTEFYPESVGKEARQEGRLRGARARRAKARCQRSGQAALLRHLGPASQSGRLEGRKHIGLFICC